MNDEEYASKVAAFVARNPFELCDEVTDMELIDGVHRFMNMAWNELFRLIEDDYKSQMMKVCAEDDLIIDIRQQSLHVIGECVNHSLSDRSYQRNLFNTLVGPFEQVILDFVKMEYTGCMLLVMDNPPNDIPDDMVRDYRCGIEEAFENMILKHYPFITNSDKIKALEDKCPVTTYFDCRDIEEYKRQLQLPRGC